MKYIRIAVLSAYDEGGTFLDNSISKAMHYWNDELHTYLKVGHILTVSKHLLTMKMLNILLSGIKYRSFTKIKGII